MLKLTAVSNLEKAINSGQFVATGELGPPKGADLTEFKENAEGMRNHVVACNITDNQTAIVRTSSIACGATLVQMGIEPIIQITVRDRNRICIQSDVLGAYALGIKNILCIAGDHQKFGNETGSKGVYDIDSIQLLKGLKDMRDEKKFMGGDEVEGDIDYFLGAVENPFADPFEYRVTRLEKKVRAGAKFIQTQCIFDLDRFERFMELVRERGLHKKIAILGGVTPIKSLGAARYMKNNVSGITIPDALIDRMKGAEDKKAEGLTIAVETIQRLKEIEGVAGVHIMAIAWEEKVPEIVERAGIYPPPKV
ncbi:MAG: 5,10-methylenetetrahydrofolate reductase [Firmicutes bacterium ML8_F2]|jgi:methylenetetrahydrofolate reductase (NADPH)|nr:MAG: 5,10-methylenetetrahydrofolate reductase [Firmicutes bacterium ML8_F2]